MKPPTASSFVLRYFPTFGLMLGFGSLGLFTFMFAVIGAWVQATMSGLALGLDSITPKIDRGKP